MDFEKGDRVTSSEVPPRESGGAYQEKQLEIDEMLTGKWYGANIGLNQRVNPRVEWYEVPVASLTFINEVPLSYKGHSKDPSLIDSK